MNILVINIVFVSCIALLKLGTANENEKQNEESRTWIITKKYQMSGDEFVKLFFEKGKILRVTHDYRDWPLYNYWWQDDQNLFKIKVSIEKVKPDGWEIQHVSLASLKASERSGITFEHGITLDQSLLVDSVLIPVTILSCKDLYMKFKETTKYSLFYSDIDKTKFGDFTRSTYVLIISGEWCVSMGQSNQAVFKNGELLYVSKNFPIKESFTRGKFLAVVITWDQQNENDKEIKCNAVTLQSVKVRQGWSRNTSIDTEVNSTELNSGYMIPPIGLGTQKLGEMTRKIVARALDIGYRLFEILNNDVDGNSKQEISNAIKDSNLSRKDIFLAVRISLEEITDDIKEMIREILKDLNTFYIDLIILEVPFRENDEETPMPQEIWRHWEDLQSFQKSGIIRSLGIRNIKDANELESFISRVGSSLSVVQNWFDPFRQDVEVRDVCRKNDMKYMGYGILGFARMEIEGESRNIVLENHNITQLARVRDIPRGSLLLRWAMERGVIVTPGSSDEYHLEGNFYSRQLGILGKAYTDIDNINVEISEEKDKVTVKDDIAVKEIEHEKPKDEL